MDEEGPKKRKKVGDGLVDISEIVNEARSAMLAQIERDGNDPSFMDIHDPYFLMSHVPEVERWAKYLLDRYPQADREATLLSVWFHDIGHYPLDGEDHAVKGEGFAKLFLENHYYPAERKEIVMHAVRAHRCRDVMPSTIEAKILAWADSASHMTDNIYLEMAKREGPEKAAEKLERDWRDLGLFPDEKAELEKFYSRWKRLLAEYPASND
jgi:hypothetical protein